MWMLSSGWYTRKYHIRKWNWEHCNGSYRKRYKEAWFSTFWPRNDLIIWIHGQAKSKLEFRQWDIRYLHIDPSKLEIDRKGFDADPFANELFWYGRKSLISLLCKTAWRLFATQVSSSASERVFSLQKKIFPPDRASISRGTIQEMVVLRSLYPRHTTK